MRAESVKEQLLAFGSPQKAADSLRFFKTGKGEYGEGDQFIGCTVPETRSVAKACKKIPLEEVKILLDDPYHECRFCALVILTERFKKAEEEERKEIFQFYLDNRRRVNNCD